MRRTYTEKNFGPAAMRVIAQADAICSEYQADGYDLTLRQLYYQFVARGFIANKQSEYKRLGAIVNDARMAGYLDWDYIVDRTRNLSDLAHWESPAEIMDAVSRQFRLAKWDRQPTRVEVWVEKEALAGVVERVCERLDVPFFACRGYVSQSEQWAASQRFYKAMTENDQDVLVLHLGDHDPSGIDMTRDNRERLEHFLTRDHAREIIATWREENGRDDGPDKIDDADAYKTLTRRLDVFRDRFTVRRIALNMDQVEEYEPPPNPAKLTDSRVAGYLDRFGDESWELDALPPDVLANLIESNVEEVRDDELWDEAEGEEEGHRSTLAAISERWSDVEAMVAD